MSETHLAFEDLEQIMQLFGPRDHNLRRIRDTVGGEIFLRGDQITFRGTDEQTRRGMEVFQMLRDRLIERGKFGISVWAGVLLDKYLYVPASEGRNRAVDNV